MHRNYTFCKKQFSFSYSLDNLDTVCTDNLIDAIDLTSLSIFEELKNNNLESVALCLSGIDSELIADSLYRNKIPTEYYFLHILGINDNSLDLVKNISIKYDTKLNLVTIFPSVIKEYSLENFHKNFVCFPTYSTVPYLLEKIPRNQYTIVGEGDIEKTDILRYLKIFNNKVNKYDKNFFYIPIHLSEISYKKTLETNGKLGETNFFSRNFNVWYHLLKDKRLITNEKFYYDPKTVLLKELTKGKFLSPIKTLNYDNFQSIDYIMNDLRKIGQGFNNWHPYIGDVVKISKDLIFSSI